VFIDIVKFKMYNNYDLTQDGYLTEKFDALIGENYLGIIRVVSKEVGFFDSHLG